ncbi:MAG: HlyC/CorC family transporter [Brachymonas sp.]
MSDPSSPSAVPPDKRSFIRKLIEYLIPGPDSHAELYNTLSQAEDNQLIESDSRAMLEGVIRIANMTADDVMVPVPRMDLLDINWSYEQLLKVVITTAHSRFPVYEDKKDNIIGMLLAKDLLKLQRAPELNLRALLRTPMFVPESKKLNDLLREFRARRNHQAIVIDEFGRLAGLITIEDILEEIVGEIEDEFDVDEDEGDIYSLADGSFRVSGDTSIDRINEHFDVDIRPSDTEDEDSFETIGGLIAHEMGHVPARNEFITLGGLNFVVMLTKGGAVRWFKVTPAAATETTP